VYKNEIMAVVFYGYKIWQIALKGKIYWKC